MTKPTNEERREVAERLRNLDAYEIRYAEQFYEELNDTVMNSWDFHSFQGLADRLADLIETAPERTCQITGVYTSHASTHLREVGRCDACGELIETGHRYCFNCGAKVER